MTRRARRLPPGQQAKTRASAPKLREPPTASEPAAAAALVAAPELPFPTCRDRPLRLALILLRPQRMPLVILALALGQGDLDLGVAVLEVDGQRNDRLAALLGLLHELGDLLLVQEQLAPATRRVVVPGPLGVLGDVHALEPDLPVTHGRETVKQRRPARAQRLDLGAAQHHAGLEGLFDQIVVVRLAIARHHLLALLLGHRRHPLVRSRVRHVRGSAPAPLGDEQAMVRREPPVSYTHLTLPTNREV